MPPSSSISFLVSSSLSALRATSSGIPPAAASFLAAALPMPLEAPVMSATLPLTAPSKERSLYRSGSSLRS